MEKEFDIFICHATEDKNEIAVPIYEACEKLKIRAEIKNVEFLLVLAIEQTFAQTGTASDHLPELRLTHNLLEKHQVQNFRHVNACVQHIDRNSDLRQLVPIGKFIQQALRIIGIVVNYPAVMRRIFRVFLIPDSQNLLGMQVVFGEDNRLADTTAVIYFQTFSQQDI